MQPAILDNKRQIIRYIQQAVFSSPEDNFKIFPWIIIAFDPGFQCPLVFQDADAGTDIVILPVQVMGQILVWRMCKRYICKKADE